jgi:nucleotide-binding universal stress UspA family protein
MCEEWTMKVQKVCVAVKDGSESPLELDAVKAIAGDHAQVCLVHVSPREYSGRGRFALESAQEASQVVEAAAREFSRAGITVHGKVCSAMVGKESEAILDEATKWGADAIVVGHSHHGRLAARVRGSVVQRVIQGSSCPVIVAASVASLGELSPVAAQVAQVA